MKQHLIQHKQRDCTKCHFLFLLQKKCENVVDKYIEYDLVVVSLDALLLKRQAFRHILINSGIQVLIFISNEV